MAREVIGWDDDPDTEIHYVPRLKDEERQTVAQVVFHGDWFKRGLPVDVGVNGEQMRVLQQRRVRIIGSFDNVGGTSSFRKADGAPTTLSDLPHRHLREILGLYDMAETCPMPNTPRKHGASTPGVDVEDVYLRDGADLTPISKPGSSFCLGESPRVIAER